MNNHQILHELALGRNVEVVTTGKSMEPRIMEGSRITIVPLWKSLETLKVGDIVFVRVNSRYLDHQIIEISDNKYVIGNINHKIDGIVTIDAIYGIIDL
jgi:signal peptidase I